MALFHEAGVDADEELILRREISASGRSRIFANDRLVTQAFVRAVRPHLVDIYSQGEAPMALVGGETASAARQLCAGGGPAAAR